MKILRKHRDTSILTGRFKVLHGLLSQVILTLVFIAIVLKAAEWISKPKTKLKNHHHTENEASDKSRCTCILPSIKDEVMSHILICFDGQDDEQGRRCNLSVNFEHKSLSESQWQWKVQKESCFHTNNFLMTTIDLLLAKHPTKILSQTLRQTNAEIFVSTFNLLNNKYHKQMVSRGLNNRPKPSQNLLENREIVAVFWLRWDQASYFELIIRRRQIRVPSLPDLFHSEMLHAKNVVNVHCTQRKSSTHFGANVVWRLPHTSTHHGELLQKPRGLSASAVAIDLRMLGAQAPVESQMGTNAACLRHAVLSLDVCMFSSLDFCVGKRTLTTRKAKLTPAECGSTNTHSRWQMSNRCFSVNRWDENRRRSSEELFVDRKGGRRTEDQRRSSTTQNRVNFVASE